MNRTIEDVRGIFIENDAFSHHIFGRKYSLGQQEGQKDQKIERKLHIELKIKALLLECHKQNMKWFRKYLIVKQRFYGFSVLN